MSVEFRLAIRSTGNLPMAGTKGEAVKSSPDAGRFGALLAGGEAGVEKNAAPRGETARTDTDWRSRKNIWAPRDLSEAPQSEYADEPVGREEEGAQDAVISFTVPNERGQLLDARQSGAETPPPAAAPADSQDRGGHEASGKDEPRTADGSPAAVVIAVSAGGQARGGREASGKDEPRTAGRSPASVAMTASAGAQSPTAVRSADASEAAPNVAATPPGEAEADTAPMVSERAAGRDTANRESAPRERMDMKVTVISSQVSVAPATPAGTALLSQTGSAFVASLSTDGALPQYVSSIPDLAPAQDARPVTTLRIQLHPAELGSVTVQLSGSGEQLAVEVQVENAEARHRLATDSDAIVKALRGMGYDIDRITVQQAPATPSSPGGGSNRENSFTPQEGRSGERQEQSARQETDQRHEQNSRRGASPGGDRHQAGSGGVYI